MEGRRESQYYRGINGTKSNGDAAYRFLINIFGINALYINANRIGKQASSLYAPTVPPLLPLLCFNNPPSSPFLRVTFPQKSNLKWQTLSLQNPEDPLFVCQFSK